VKTLASHSSPTVSSARHAQRIPAQDRSSTPLLFDPNLRTPYSNQWNLSIQRQLTRDTVLEVADVGNQGVHLFRRINANQLILTPDFIAGFKAAQGGGARCCGKLLDTYGTTLPSSVTTFFTNNDIGGFGELDRHRCSEQRHRRSSDGGWLPQSYFHNPQFSTGALACTCTTSSYRLSAGVHRPPLLRGLMTQFNYTLAKSLDDVSDDTNAAGTTFLLPRDSTNVKLDRARSNFNVRH
jgi:hypothetical protein